MNALHLRTSGFYCAACPLVVENALAPLPGVAQIAVVRSAGLTSVLYDPDVVGAEELCERIRRAGFGAEVYRAEPEPPHAAGADASC